MAVNVTAFSALARSEFMDGKIAADMRPMPISFDNFVTTIPSTTRIETHTFMSNLPRLREFKGYSPGEGLTNTPYTGENKEYRIGPVKVRKTDLDDDQIGGYLRSIKALPAQGQKDIGFRILDKLAAGTSTAAADLGFDGAAFFAATHNIGSGNNLMTADNTGNDGVTHKILAMIPTNPVIKPLMFQDRESLSELLTDAETPQAAKQKEFEYWADCRFGLVYGFWWDAILLTITDTPTLTELIGHIRDIVNRFRSFTLPKGADLDSAMYVHEGWMPSATELVLLCNMGLGELLSTVRTESLIAAGTSGATVTNQYREKFTAIPTSALGA